MTVCYDTGTLQAFLEGEITGNEKAEIAKHLLNCSSCREAVEQVRENQAFANTRLAGYLQTLGKAEVDTGAAWSRFNNSRLSGQNNIRPRKGVLNMLSKYRMAATAAVMVLALAVSFSFGSVRSMASELLTIFRVEKVQTVNISSSDLSNIEKAFREGAGAVDIKNFGKIEFKGKEASTKVTMEEARGAVDFQLKLPAKLPEGYQAQEFHVNSGSTASFTLDTVNTNQVLKSLGSEKLLPDDLNGKTFTVNVPAQVTAMYAGPDSQRIFVGQGRSPELTAPGSDMDAIRDALLALPFLPEDLRSQLAAINDWQHTFVIPNVGGTSQEVSVGDSQGVFITPSAGENAKGDDKSSNCLIWQKAGVVYAIGGHLTLGQAVEMAASMK